LIVSGARYFSKPLTDWNAIKQPALIDRSSPRKIKLGGRMAERPWSEVDLDNLRSQLKLGTPLAEIAGSLGRDSLEVQSKIEQLAVERR
jgi:hypothetical protein